MKRRSFLQLLGAAPAVAVAPSLVKSKRVDHLPLARKIYQHRMGLATIKEEGQPFDFWNQAALDEWYRRHYV